MFIGIPTTTAVMAAKPQSRQKPGSSLVVTQCQFLLNVLPSLIIAIVLSADAERLVNGAIIVTCPSERPFLPSGSANYTVDDCFQCLAGYRLNNVTVACEQCPQDVSEPFQIPYDVCSRRENNSVLQSYANGKTLECTICPSNSPFAPVNASLVSHCFACNAGFFRSSSSLQCETCASNVIRIVKS